jgi:endonuclease YncB( thermonuclease family)
MKPTTRKPRQKKVASTAEGAAPIDPGQPSDLSVVALDETVRAGAKPPTLEVAARPADLGKLPALDSDTYITTAYLKDLAETTAKTPNFSLAGRSALAKCVRVYDGDTAHFTFALGPNEAIHKYRCRLSGYNSAEIKGETPDEKVKAQKSKAALAELIDGRFVKLRLGAFDMYGRPLVDVYVDGLHVNQRMVEGGWGKVYTGRGKKEF